MKLLSGDPAGQWSETSLQTSHWDEACSIAGRAYFPHRLTALTRDSSLNMHIHAVHLGPITLGHLSFGADVRLDCGELGTGYEVNIPVSGHIKSVCGRAEVTSGPGAGTVYGPEGDTAITHWSADCALHGIKFDRHYLEEELERLLQRPVRLPIRIAPNLDVSREPGLGWFRLVKMLAAQLRYPGNLLQNRVLAEQFCTSLAAGLLFSVPHDYTEELTDAQRPARPNIIRRAVDTLEERPSETWSVADIAQLTGCSVRRLQEGFQQYVGMPPITYLREVRLKRVHEELRDAAGAEHTVADVAFRWGFSHLGRFAAAYRRKYDVAPSYTLSIDR